MLIRLDCGVESFRQRLGCMPEELLELKALAETCELLDRPPLSVGIEWPTYTLVVKIWPPPHISLRGISYGNGIPFSLCKISKNETKVRLMNVQQEVLDNLRDWIAWFDDRIESNVLFDQPQERTTRKSELNTHQLDSEMDDCKLNATERAVLSTLSQSYPRSFLPKNLPAHDFPEEANRGVNALRQALKSLTKKGLVMHLGRNEGYQASRNRD